MPRFNIEQKHIYRNYKIISNIDVRNALGIDGATYKHAPLMYVTPNYPAGGSTDTQRIGNKINSINIIHEYIINVQARYTGATSASSEPSISDNARFIPSEYKSNLFNKSLFYGGFQVHQTTNTFGTYDISQAAPIRFSAKFRILYIEVDENGFTQMFKSADDSYGDASLKILKWFFNQMAYIQPYSVDIDQWSHTTTPLSQLTNQVQLKRESTDETGEYRILSDKTITITQQCTHLIDTINYRRNLQFTNSADVLPSNKRIICVIIPPLSYLDANYDYVRCQKLTTNSGDTALYTSNLINFDVVGNIKLNYVDF